MTWLVVEYQCSHGSGPIYQGKYCVWHTSSCRNEHYCSITCRDRPSTLYRGTKFWSIQFVKLLTWLVVACQCLHYSCLIYEGKYGVWHSKLPQRVSSFNHLLRSTLNNFFEAQSFDRFNLSSSWHYLWWRFSDRIIQVQYIKASIAFDTPQAAATSIIVQLLVEIDPQHFIEVQSFDRFNLLSFWHACGGMSVLALFMSNIWRQIWCLT